MISSFDKDLCFLNGREMWAREIAARESLHLCADKYKEEEISQGCAICCFDSAESYRWSKIVLPVRKTITFRHLFLSELGLQLYLSLNNLRLFFFLPFLLFFPLPLSVSDVRRLPGLKGCSCQIKLLRTKWKLISHTTRGETGVFFRLQQPISRETRSIVNK